MKAAKNIKIRAITLGRQIMRWHDTQNRRELPWKETDNPYKIWISEVMSQQTKLENVIAYYYKFIERFPTIEDMADVDEDTILAMWTGLGYYNRARNMLKTARIITEEYNGAFPRDYDKILNLPGIGEYTAAAIVSFAYGEVYPVIDVNVKRIYSRINAIATRPDRKKSKEKMVEFLRTAMKTHPAAEFNQAIMDFGAQVCTARSPDCPQCPLREICSAYSSDSVQLFPVRHRKIDRKNRMFHYVVMKHENKVYLRKREDKDIWRNMWEFPQIENKNETIPESIIIENFQPNKSRPLAVNDVSPIYAQTLSHRYVKARFYILNIEAEIKRDELVAIELNHLSSLAFPGIIRNFLSREYGVKF